MPPERKFIPRWGIFLLLPGAVSKIYRRGCNLMMQRDQASYTCLTCTRFRQTVAQQAIRVKPPHRVMHSL